MKRFHLLLALVSFAFTGSGQAATQDELYVSFYQMIQQADTLIGRKQEKSAVELYRSAQAGLEKLQKDNPGWNKQIIDFRLDYIKGKLGPLDAKYPATAAKPAPKKKKPAPTVVQTELSAINDLLIKERMKSADLRNKLQEALGAKPAEVDPAMHAKIQADLAAANQRAGELAGELEAMKSQTKDMIAADEAKQLKRALEDSESLAAKRMKKIESLKDEQSKTEGELEKLEKSELPALRSENTALKRQIKDLERKAGSTMKAERAAQQAGAQNKILARELDDARDAAKSANAKLSNLNDEVARKDAALVKMQRELDALEVRVKNSGESAKSASLRRENSALKKQISSLTKKAEAAEKAEKATAELEARNESLAEELQALKKRSGNASDLLSENKKLTEQARSLEAQLKAARDAMKAQERQYAKVVPEAELDKAEDALKAALRAKERAEKNSFKAAREIDELNRKLKAADSSRRSSDLRKENAALKEEVEKLTRLLNDPSVNFKQ